MLSFNKVLKSMYPAALEWLVWVSYVSYLYMGCTCFLLVSIRAELELWCTMFKYLSSLRKILWSLEYIAMISTHENIKYNNKDFSMMTYVMFNFFKSLTLKILNPIVMMIVLIALFERICLKEMKFSGNWDACQTESCESKVWHFLKFVY
jgi:hypothetical protein